MNHITQPPLQAYLDQINERPSGSTTSGGCVLALVYQEGYGQTVLCSCVPDSPDDVERIIDLHHLFSMCTGKRESVFLRQMSIREYKDASEKTLARAQNFVPREIRPNIEALKSLAGMAL